MVNIGVEHATEASNDSKQAEDHKECEHGWFKMGVKEGIAGKE